ncbi:MAG: glycosyl transferase family protein [Parcubacteria group bacterium Gr01-1014_106]|nr:MAG: glycosyl transferase family protein [Parcubacteria group bacterium Gr01-1014_106]
MTLTVIIPARNGAGTLPRVLRSLHQQLRPSDGCIVVDDGSTDDTALIVARERAAFSCHLQLIQQAHRGAAAARNAGIAAATTELIVFLGADILPHPACIERHRSVHQRFLEASVGCVGFVTWDPQLPPTPLMVWLEHGGPENAYGQIAGQTWVDVAQYCYGANISFKRQFVATVGGFNEQEFCTYGWEDCDFGIRLADHGGRLFYEPTARAYHAHAYSFPAWESRQIAAGKSFVNLVRLHSKRHALPASAHGWRYAARRAVYGSPLGTLLFALARFAERRWIFPRLYARVSGWVFTESVHGSLSR